MITLYSYPELFGAADNNPYGLKVYAFLKLSRLTFQHRQILDARHAPRAQLPYIDDDGQVIGDSGVIIRYLTGKYGLDLDGDLTPAQRDLSVMVNRTLDDLYWVMSYSRWADVRFWPLFRDAFVNAHPSVTAESLEKARQYNLQRYYYQGIGRYEPDAVYERGTGDLRAISSIVPEAGYIFGPAPGSIDASLYGFIANIYFSSIETPLKTLAKDQANLAAHCLAVHKAIGSMPV